MIREFVCNHLNSRGLKFHINNDEVIVENSDFIVLQKLIEAHSFILNRFPNVGAIQPYNGDCDTLCFRIESKSKVFNPNTGKIEYLDDRSNLSSKNKVFYFTATS